MSQHDDDFAAAARADHLAVYGDTLTYTPKGGSGVAIAAAFEELAESLEPTDRGQTLIRTGTIKASVADVASPQLGDKWTKDDEVWEHLEVMGTGGGLVELRVVRRQRREATNREYRSEA